MNKSPQSVTSRKEGFTNRRFTMIRKLLVTSIAAATTLAAVPALAQNGQQSIEEIQVTSTLRKSAGLADVNAAVSVLGEQELDLIKLTHLQEALNRLPGVSIHRNNGQESLLAILMRKTIKPDVYLLSFYMLV